MARYLGPKYKICRRIGENLWGRPNDPSGKRPYPAGEHGPKGQKKISNYGKHLLEKQKLRMYYGMLEKQFRNAFTKATIMRGVTGDNLQVLLETRLDALIYRLGYMPTIWAARQWVNHGHVRVNGKKVDIPSYTCKAGDEISIREKSRQNGIMLASLRSRRPDQLAPYLSRNDEAFSGTLSRMPIAKEIPIPVKIDTNLIVEFYSR